MATGSDNPLKREAENREKWRGDDGAVPQKSGGHRVPGGDDEDEKAKEGVRSGAGGLGVAPPPD